MKLLHSTDIDNIENIKKYGLLSDKKNGYTQKLAICLNYFKPKTLPQYIDLNKCVYFAPKNACYTVGGLMSSSVALNIDSNDLDTKKLYVASYFISEKVDKIVKQNVCGVNRKEKIEKMVSSNYFKTSCNKYWKSFVPFSFYRSQVHRNMMKKDFVDSNEFVELLYFDNVPPNIIKF